MAITDDQALEIALRGRVVIGTASDGTVWAGTEHWLIKDPDAVRQNEAAIEALATSTYDVLLTPVRHRHAPVVTQIGSELIRLYQRPDGHTVRISDARMSVVESMLEEEDEFGEGTFLPDLTLRQRGKRRGPVGVFVGADKEAEGHLVAVLMPLTITNDHLEEPLGREGS